LVQPGLQIKADDEQGSVKSISNNIDNPFNPSIEKDKINPMSPNFKVDDVQSNNKKGYA